MNNKKFKEIKTGVKSLEKIYLGFKDKVVAVEINGSRYSILKQEGGLTAKQLEFFEFMPDYNGEPINI